MLRPSSNKLNRKWIAENFQKELAEAKMGHGPKEERSTHE